MKQKVSGLVLVGAAVAAYCGPANSAAWVCTAKDMADYNYDGGSTAYVRLSQFNRGSHYSVTKSKDGKKATGTTGNNTPFTCTLKG